jgi:ATP-dependent RNA helicase SUPV3L1/SUV3
MIDLPKLPDYQFLSENLESERKAIMKGHGFQDEEYIRDSEDAKLILAFIEKIQRQWWEFFKQYPSLLSLFQDQYGSFHQFLENETILDLCFLDDCLFPDKELFFFGHEGAINPTFLDIHEKEIIRWCDERGQKHDETQKLIHENFDLELKSNEFSCQCVVCLGDYRNQLREFIYNDCISRVHEGEKEIEELLEQAATLERVSDAFKRLQKDLDKKFYRVRFRLKRSNLNRLENQVKSEMKERFHFPSLMTRKLTKLILPVFKNHLYESGFNDDLITDQEYDRFFNQLSSNIWKNESYLITEFKKQVKSLLVLKKKDLSSRILTDYLGAFWTHSNARQIKRKIIYHMGPTNSGKTYHAIQALCQAKKGCYLAPLRLLAAELYDTMNTKGVVTTLLTGEEVIEVEGATHYSSTIEMARFQEIFDCAVIDEIQMMSDPQRGWAWTRALVNLFATEVHLCGDASVLELVKVIVDLCGDELEIKEYQRMTRLEVEPNPIRLADLEKSDALIVFSRRNALRHKRDLERLNFKVSIVYGMLSPEVRREQARKFDSQETDIIVSTDAIAMGMNLPIKRIVFSTLTKYINNNEHLITDSEIKQIAGRAGRYLRFPTGYVNCLTTVDDGLGIVTEALNATLEQKTKCMVGPDLDIYSRVNTALEANGLPGLKLSEFLRLFNTMTFQKPFFCVELAEMIELAEMVEDADQEAKLSISEVFGFACAPVNLGLVDHIQYYIWILNNFVSARPIKFSPIDSKSNDIDYLEASIKCMELYQWLSRHFDNKHFEYFESELLENKSQATEKLNELLSDKIVPMCTSCGTKLAENSKFAICEPCFKSRRFGGQRKTSMVSTPKGAQSGGSRFKPNASGDKGKEGESGRRRTRKRKFSGPRKK